MDYANTITLDLDYDQAVERVKAAFKEQGFGTLTEIDVKATLKEKLDEDMEPYVILGACNPQLAHKALNVDRRIGLLLPCNVVVRREGDHTIVDALRPSIIADVPDLEALRPIADEAAARIGAAMDALAAGTA